MRKTEKACKQETETTREQQIREGGEVERVNMGESERERERERERLRDRLIVR